MVSTAPVAAISSTSAGAQVASAVELLPAEAERVDEAHRLRLKPEHVVQRAAGLAQGEVERRRLERRLRTRSDSPEFRNRPPRKLDAGLQSAIVDRRPQTIPASIAPPFSPDRSRPQAERN
jgi:hypothetical protein